MSQRATEWLIIIILVNVFPIWWQAIAVIAVAAFLGAIEQAIVEWWQNRQSRKHRSN